MRRGSRGPARWSPLHGPGDRAFEYPDVEEGPMASMHDFTMDAITGEPVALSDYEGQVCLVVNLASQ